MPDDLVEQMLGDANEVPKVKDKTLITALSDLQKAIENTVNYFGGIDENDLPGLLRAFRQLHEAKQLLDGMQKLLGGLHDQVSYDKIPALFEEHGIDSMSLGGRLFSLNARQYVSVETADKEKQEKAFEWLRSNGYSALVKETVNTQALSSAMNERFEETGKLPAADEGFKIYAKRYTSVRKV